MLGVLLTPHSQEETPAAVIQDTINPGRGDFYNGYQLLLLCQFIHVDLSGYSCFCYCCFLLRCHVTGRSFLSLCHILLAACSFMPMENQLGLVSACGTFSCLFLFVWEALVCKSMALSSDWTAIQMGPGSLMKSFSLKRHIRPNHLMQKNVWSFRNVFSYFFLGMYLKTWQPILRLKCSYSKYPNFLSVILWVIPIPMQCVPSTFAVE